MKKLPNKLVTKDLPDTFKKQIIEYVNELNDCIKELREEIKILKS